MATRTLVISYLSRLTNANHDGVTQQIDDRLQAFETDDQMLVGDGEDGCPQQGEALLQHDLPADQGLDGELRTMGLKK